MNLPPKSHYISPLYQPKYRLELGSMICTTAGDGRYIGPKKSFAARVIVDLVSHCEMAIPVDDTGKVTGVYGSFELHFYKPMTEGHPYTDKGVEKAVNHFLASLDIPGRVDWSELGRQSPYHADFDADMSIYAHLFPEAIEARLRDFHGID